MHELVDHRELLVVSHVAAVLGKLKPVEHHHLGRPGARYPVRLSQRVRPHLEGPRDPAVDLPALEVQPLLPLGDPLGDVLVGRVRLLPAHESGRDRKE